MSLVFGTGSKLIGAAVGSLSASRLLLSNNLRAFQTLSVPVCGNKSDVSGSTSTTGRWDTKNDIYSMKNASSMQYSSLANYCATPSCSTTNQYQNALLIAQTSTRSMASLPTSEGGDEQQFRDGKPTLAYAKKLPKTFASMTNEQVLQFAEMGIPEACRECIVRDVMVVDQVEYDEAMKTFDEIAANNRRLMWLAAMPFKAGFLVSFTGGIASIPLVFELKSVEWFNEHYVTAEMPPPTDLETWLEVGSASWGWMEPVLGQVSFLLLCMQFARSQLKNLGIRPYFNWQREMRAARLVAAYPKYDAEFLSNYSKCDQLFSPHKMSP